MECVQAMSLGLWFAAKSMSFHCRLCQQLFRESKDPFCPYFFDFCNPYFLIPSSFPWQIWASKNWKTTFIYIMIHVWSKPLFVLSTITSLSPLIAGVIPANPVFQSTVGPYWPFVTRHAKFPCPRGALISCSFPHTNPHNTSFLKFLEGFSSVYIQGIEIYFYILDFIRVLYSVMFFGLWRIFYPLLFAIFIFFKLNSFSTLKNTVVILASDFNN